MRMVFLGIWLILSTSVHATCSTLKSRINLMDAAHSMVDFKDFQSLTHLKALDSAVASAMKAAIAVIENKQRDTKSIAAVRAANNTAKLAADSLSNVATLAKVDIFTLEPVLISARETQVNAGISVVHTIYALEC